MAHLEELTPGAASGRPPGGAGDRRRRRTGTARRRHAHLPHRRWTDRRRAPLPRRRAAARSSRRPAPPGPSTATATLFRLVSEAKRIHLAYLFDPLLAVHTSACEPLPHQITAVYEEMLPRQPLRFLLADDPGAGKTIMAGLLIKELHGPRRRPALPHRLPGQPRRAVAGRAVREVPPRFEILTRRDDRELHDRQPVRREGPAHRPPRPAGPRTRSSRPSSRRPTGTSWSSTRRTRCRRTTSATRSRRPSATSSASASARSPATSC